MRKRDELATFCCSIRRGPQTVSPFLPRTPPPRVAVVPSYPHLCCSGFWRLARQVRGTYVAVCGGDATPFVSVSCACRGLAVLIGSQQPRFRDDGNCVRRFWATGSLFMFESVGPGILDRLTHCCNLLWRRVGHGIWPRLECVKWHTNRSNGAH